MAINYDVEYPKLQRKYTDALREIEKLLAHHKNLVERNAFLRQRPDLPVDRIPAYLRLQAENFELKQKLGETPWS